MEFQKISNALDVSLCGQLHFVQTAIAETAVYDERFATPLKVLSELFSGLPTRLIQALDDIEGIGGAEIRREGAVPLKEAMVEKLVKEVLSIMARRAVITETSRFCRALNRWRR